MMESLVAWYNDTIMINRCLTISTDNYGNMGVHGIGYS